MNNFKTYNSIGKIAEQSVIRLFNGGGLITTPVDDVNRSFWDLESIVPNSWLIKNNSIKTEVKHDVEQNKTKNIAIEVWNTHQNKPSGINLTKADLWAHVLSDRIFLCRVSDLRNFILIPPKRIVEKAGDGNARIYLYEADLILNSIFHRIDKLTVRELQDKVKLLCKVKY